MFPRTAEQLSNGRCRWVKYSRGTLEVAIGHGTGRKLRDPCSGNVLRKWEAPFETLHDLMCAVECSWVMPGSPSSPAPAAPLGDTVLLKDDGRDALGSKPKCLPVLARPQDSRLLKPAPGAGTWVSERVSEREAAASKRGKATAVALGPVAPGESSPRYVYSGHRNGTLMKWSLNPSCVGNSDECWAVMDLWPTITTRM